MSKADEIFREAFAKPRDPRSKAYKDGVLRTLRLRLGDVDAVSADPLMGYELGTPECDAYFAGTDEGHRRAREYLEKSMEPTPEKIGEALTAIVARADAELMELDESALAAKWYWCWEEDGSIEWNTYKFSAALEMHKRRCRRWEEHHNGSSASGAQRWR